MTMGNQVAFVVDGSALHFPTLNIKNGYLFFAAETLDRGAIHDYAAIPSKLPPDYAVSFNVIP